MRILFKLLVSLLLLAALVRYLDPGAVITRLQHVNYFWVALACLLMVTGQILSAIRWSWLARGLGLSVRTGRKIELYFLGMFLSLFLPSTIGGDVARGYLLARGRSGAGWAAAASVVLERINGVLALTIIATACLFRLDLPRGWQWIWLSLVIGLWLGTIGYAYGHRHLPDFLHRWRMLPIDSRAFRLAWWRSLGLSLTFQFLVVEAHVILGHAAGLVMPWPAYGLMVSLVALASAIPVSFNGFGIREAGYVGMATYFGGTADAAAVMAALWVLVLAIAALPGAWVLWRLGGTRALKSGAGEGMRPG